MWKTTVAAPTDGTYEVFVTFHGDPKEDQRIQAGLSEKNLLWFGPLFNQQMEEPGLYRADVGRVKVSKGQPIEIFLNDRIAANGVAEAVRNICLSPVTTK
jgi:hypothetical protein